MNLSNLLPPYSPKVWKWLTIIALALVITASAIIYKRCTRPKTITPEQIVKAQQAIATEDRKAMEEVFTEAAANEAAADTIVSDAEKAKQAAITEAKKKVATMSNQELADELNRLANQ